MTGLYRKERQQKGKPRPVPELEKFGVVGRECQPGGSVTGRDCVLLGEPSGQRLL